MIVAQLFKWTLNSFGHIACQCIQVSQYKYLSKFRIWDSYIIQASMSKQIWANAIKVEILLHYRFKAFKKRLLQAAGELTI